MTKRLPLLLACLGILLRIVPIWAMPVWYDEAFTLLVARLPLDRLLAATAGDVHPPLYYLLCWPLAHIPGLPAWLIVRLPALLFGIASLWVFWEIIKWMLGNRTVKLVAFGLFCLLPQQIYYAQEGRMYSLLTLLVLLAWLCLLERRWVWLGVVTTLLLYTHNYGLIYAAALWLAYAVYILTAFPPYYKIQAALKMVKPTMAMALAGILFIPWVLVLFRQMETISGGYWLHPETLPSLLADMSKAWFVEAPFRANLVNVAVFWGLLLWALISLLRRRSLDLAVATLSFLPLILAALVSIAWHPIVLDRALIPSTAFLCLLLAAPLEYLGRRPALVAAVFFVPALLLNLGTTLLRSRWAAEPIQRSQDAIALIDSNWQPGDLLYLADDGYFITGSVSWQHIDNVLRTPVCGPVKGGISVQTRAALGLTAAELPETSGRIWVITSETPLNTTCENDYLEALGLLESDPLTCPSDNFLVTSCVYLFEEN